MDYKGMGKDSTRLLWNKIKAKFLSKDTKYAAGDSVGGNAIKANTSAGVTDYNNASRNIKIGYVGNGLTAGEVGYLAGYNSAGNIKDISKNEAKDWLEINSEIEALKKELKEYVNNQATTGFDIDKVYPVGSVYISAGNIDPNNVFTGTTWERFGKGHTLVGCDDSDTDFANLGKTGGEKTHALTEDEMPEHSHDITIDTKSLTGSVWNFIGQDSKYGPGNSTSGVFSKGGDPDSFYASQKTEVTGIADGFTLNATHSHTASASTNGGGASHNNMPPYIVVEMWKRTA